MVQNRFLILSLILPLFTGCSNTIDYMVVGVGTQKGNSIFVTDLLFDNTWAAPVGSVGCCWTWGPKSSGVYDKAPPKSVYVKWHDDDPKTVYESTIQLSRELYKLAIDLPPYHWTAQDKTESDVHPYLILGLGKTGEVVVWISNAATDRNKTGRVLHEVGRAQATVHSFDPE